MTKQIRVNQNLVENSNLGVILNHKGYAVCPIAAFNQVANIANIAELTNQGVYVDIFGQVFNQMGMYQGFLNKSRLLNAQMIDYNNKIASKHNSLGVLGGITNGGSVGGSVMSQLGGMASTGSEIFGDVANSLSPMDDDIMGYDNIDETSVIKTLNGSISTNDVFLEDID